MIIPNERVTVPISDQALDDALNDLKSFRSRFPQGFKMSTRERVRALKVGYPQIGFINEVIKVARLHPGFFPSYYNISNFEVKYQNMNQLVSLQSSVEMTVEQVADTILLTHDEAYRVALFYYKTLKQLADSGVPGTKSIYGRLRQFFLYTQDEREAPSNLLLDENGKLISPLPDTDNEDE